MLFRSAQRSNPLKRLSAFGRCVVLGYFVAAVGCSSVRPSQFPNLPKRGSAYVSSEVDPVTPIDRTATVGVFVSDSELIALRKVGLRVEDAMRQAGFSVCHPFESRYIIVVSLDSTKKESYHTSRSSGFSIGIGTKKSNPPPPPADFDTTTTVDIYKHVFLFLYERKTSAEGKHEPLGKTLWEGSITMKDDYYEQGLDLTLAVLCAHFGEDWKDDQTFRKFDRDLRKTPLPYDEQHGRRPRPIQRNYSSRTSVHAETPAPGLRQHPAPVSPAEVSQSVEEPVASVAKDQGRQVPPPATDDPFAKYQKSLEAVDKQSQQR